LDIVCQVTTKCTTVPKSKPFRELNTAREIFFAGPELVRGGQGNEKRHQKTATGSADQLPVMLAPQYWTTSIYPAWLHPAAAVLLQCGNACDVPA